MIDKTFAAVLVLFASASAGATVSCVGPLLGERLCSNLPARAGDRPAPKMITGSELKGELAPKVAFVAERFNSHNDNADYQVAQSADGSLALGEALRADSQMRDVEDRLKGWQIPGGRSSLPTATAAGKPTR